MKFKCAAQSLSIILFLMLCLMTPVPAAAENAFDTLSVYWENDAFVGTDRDYTNGLKFSLSTPYKTGRTTPHLPDWTLPVMELLPFVNDPAYPRAVSVSVGQDIYTPEDTDRKDLIEDDRPYAGITYMSAGFHSIKEGRKNSWEFLIGILGPQSYAEDLQNWTHDSIHSRRARGWGNQLKDEPLGEAVYETQWRQFQSRSAGGFGFDVRAVLWDITLDGNTYQDSHSVDKLNIVADFMTGIGMEYGRIRASYSYIYRTKQFRSQRRNQIFGALSVSYSY